MIDGEEDEIAINDLNWANKPLVISVSHSVSVGFVFRLAS